jgi:adenylate cyclase
MGVKTCRLTENCITGTHKSVKTTLEIDPGLHSRAKAEAARRRISLTRLVEEALRQQLDGPKQAPRRTAFRVKARNLSMKPAFRAVSMNKLAAQLEDESIMAAGES